jgi:hypothetical protein
MGWKAKHLPLDDAVEDADRDASLGVEEADGGGRRRTDIS